MQLAEGRVWPAMLTPLDDDGTPRLSVIDRLVDVFVQQELGGLYVLGSTGQGILLPVETRRQVAKRVVQAAAGRIPVMLHVGAVATDDAVALAEHAAEIGADAVSSVPPIYYPARFDAVLEHYRRVGSATDLPFFPYHASFLAQALPPAAQYAEQLLDLPNVAGMKFTDHNMYVLGLLHEYSGGRLFLFSGADELLCQAAVSGASGAIGSFYNVFGDVCQQVRQAFVAGDVQRGRRFMLCFQRTIDSILVRGGPWGFFRQAMQQKYDLDVGPPRAPLAVCEPPWDPADVERIIQEVETAAQ